MPSTTLRKRPKRGEGKANRRLQRELATRAFYAEALQVFRDIIVEIIRVCKSNPFIGAVVGLVIVDILTSLHIVSAFVGKSIAILFGIELGAAAISDLTALIGAITGNLKETGNDLKPVTTIDAAVQEGAGTSSQPSGAATAASLGLTLAKSIGPLGAVAFE